MGQLHGATLNGAVNPNGAETAAWFDYGLDSTYGKVATIPMTFVGTTEIPVSVDLINELEASTEYHFRLVAQNEAGLTEGEDEIFTTLADVLEQPTVTTLPATNIT